MDAKFFTFNFRHECWWRIGSSGVVALTCQVGNDSHYNITADAMLTCNYQM